MGYGAANTIESMLLQSVAASGTRATVGSCAGLSGTSASCAATVSLVTPTFYVGTCTTRATQAISRKVKTETPALLLRS